MIVSNHWQARLGNNIIQLCNIIDIALFYKHSIIFKVNHKYFNLKVITNYFRKYKDNIINKKKRLTDKKNFFRAAIDGLYPKEVFEINKVLRLKLLKKSFIIKDSPKLDVNDLVIHIRSGDIFSKNPHPNYIPPPLTYYINQINKREYKKIIIVSEDKKNPVVDKLLKLYKNSEYNKNSLTKDIKIILGATNIVYSVGTFVPSLLRMSDNIKSSHGKDCDNTELRDYYKVMKPWKNTKKQNDYILTYQFNTG